MQRRCAKRPCRGGWWSTSARQVPPNVLEVKWRCVVIDPVCSSASAFPFSRDAATLIGEKEDYPIFVQLLEALTRRAAFNFGAASDSASGDASSTALERAASAGGSRAPGLALLNGRLAQEILTCALNGEGVSGVGRAVLEASGGGHLAAIAAWLATSGLLQGLVLPEDARPGSSQGCEEEVGAKTEGVCPAEKREGDGSHAVAEAVLALLGIAASQLQPWQVKARDSSSSGASGAGQAGETGVAGGNLEEGVMSLSVEDRRALPQGAGVIDGVLRPDGSPRSGHNVAEVGGPENELEGNSTETRVHSLHNHADHHALSSDLFSRESAEAQDFLPSDNSQQSELSALDQQAPIEPALEPFGLIRREGEAEIVPKAPGLPVDPQAVVDTVVTSIVEQIARRAQLVSARGRSRMVIQLEPKDLGKVRVHLSVGANGMDVRLSAESSDAREIIESSLPRLKAAFETQGIILDRFEVTIAPGFSAFASSRRDAEQQGLGVSQSPGYYSWDEEPEAESGQISDVAMGTSLVDYRI